MTELLTVNQLSKSFSDHKRILNTIHFSLQQGKVLSIVGPSGSGKTTLLRILAGLESPDQGTVWINGQDMTTFKANKRPVSLVFQQPLLFPHMSVKQNIQFGAKVAKKHDRSSDLLEAIGLSHVANNRPDQLSGGQQQRVALARAMATEPDLLLFDEPFSHLDRQLRQEMRNWVKLFLKERDMTAIFVTHDTEEAEMLGDNMGVFYDGQFQQLAPPMELHHAPATPFVARFLGGHLLLESHHYIPLADCSFFPLEETSRSLRAKVRSYTYIHGQLMGHLVLEGLDQSITMPVPLSIKEKEEIDLFIPLSKVRTFPSQ